MGTVHRIVILLLAVVSCITSENSNREDKFILYDVNYGEGFNLRRDVFMRVAVFVKHLNQVSKKYRYTLVLPPWGRLYHWQSRDLPTQIRIPWSDFFDVASIRRFVPVMDLEDYLTTSPEAQILDQVFYLQNYKEGWKDGKFEEKYDFRDCLQEGRYIEQEGFWRGFFWGYNDVIKSKGFKCVSVQGSAEVITPLVQEMSGTSLVLDRAEQLLHDEFGGVDYWRVRRSMRFAPKLTKISDEFRKENLDSNDADDNTVMADKWEDHRPERSHNRGGPYACVHLRRKDFVHSRGDQIPSLKGAADQLVKKLDKHNLKKLYVATDAPSGEYEELKRHIGQLDGEVTVHRFVPSKDVKEDLKDGGVAIVDQIICSHAKYFVGSYESTFSFRIQEEREIMGFHDRLTFDMLCADGKEDCEKGSKWKIVYPKNDGNNQKDEL